MLTTQCIKATSSDRHGVSITDQSNVCSTVCSDCQQRNIKGPRYCPFVRRSHCDQWFPTQKESNMEMLLFDDVIMDWRIPWRHMYHITQYTHYITVINQTMLKRGRDVGIPLVSLLSLGSIPQDNNALCKEQRDYHLAECGRWAPKVTKGLTESFAGKTFEVFTRFKPNLVWPLGWSVDGAHQLQSKKMIHCKSHLTV